MAELRTVSGPGPENRFPLASERVIIGRHVGCDIVVDSAAVSRNHAQILGVSGEYFVEDLRSRNGTFVNQARIEGRRLLKDRDQIRICDAVFEFSAGSGEKSPLAMLPQLLKEQNVNFRGPSWQSVQADLRNPDTALSRRLRQDFHRVIVLDAIEGEHDGAFHMDRFLRDCWARIAAAFGLPYDSQAFHPQQIAQALKSEEPALFCFVDVHRLSEDELHQLRGLGFTQEEHHVLYVGSNESLRSMAFPLAPTVGESVDPPPEDRDVVAIVSSSTLIPSMSLRRPPEEDRLREAMRISKAILAGGHDPAAIGNGFLEVTAKVFPQCESGVVIFRQHSGELTAVSSWDRGTLRSPVRVFLDVVNDAIRSKRAIHSAQKVEPRSIGSPAGRSLGNVHVTSVMCAPLCGLDGEVVGAVQLATHFFQRFDEDDVKFLASLAAPLGISLHSVQLQQQLLESKRRDDDLQLAASVQTGFLPVSRPVMPNYEFADYYRSADYLGGDFYAYVEKAPDRFVVSLGDVAGRGAAAALLMAMLTSSVHHHVLAEETLVGAMSAINAEIIRLGAGHRFVTLILAELNSSTHELTVVNAGHISPLLRRSSGEIESFGQSSEGLPVGVAENVEYQSVSTRLDPGDLMLLFTDGVSESMDSSNQLYGLDRIRQKLSSSSESASHFLETLLKDVESFRGSCDPRDDICAIACRRST